MSYAAFESCAAISNCRRYASAFVVALDFTSLTLIAPDVTTKGAPRRTVVYHKALVIHKVREIIERLFFKDLQYDLPAW